MIFVDNREGSKHFAPLLKKAGVETELCRLDFGDLEWCGRGEGGTPVSVGVEFKRLQDLVSSIRTERLQGHQLPGMRSAPAGKKPRYEFAYLLIQGELKTDARGMLMRQAGPQRFKPLHMNVSELFKRLNTLHLVGGLNWVWLPTQRAVVQWIEATYRTWTDQDLDKHKSHLAAYAPKPLVPMSDFQQALIHFPGVGRKVAMAAEKTFHGSIRRACTASAADWAALTTVDDKGKSRRFGETMARRLVEALR